MAKGKGIERLSETAIRKAQPGMHSDGAGLYLQVTTAADKSLTRSWVFRYPSGRTVTSAAGKVRREEKNMGLGSLASVSLGAARELAAKYRSLRAQGIDPIESRRAAKAGEAVLAAKAMSFDECADRYLIAHRAGWKSPKHHSQWKATLATYASPLIGKLPVQSIDRGLVIKVLQPVWKAKPETANRVRGRIEMILDFAEACGYRAEGSSNPARLLPIKTALGARASKVVHHAALPYAELPAFMTMLRAQEATSARALEFTILTAVRTGETIGATWPEVDTAGKVWTIPGERMKAGREHRVPLSGAAIAICKRMAEIRENEHVFPGDRRAGLSNMSMLMLLRRIGRDDLTVHGFRATFKTWASECSNFPRDVIEAALAHVVGNQVEQAYQRGDLFAKRARLMGAWSEFCSKAASAGKVVPLRA